MSTRSNIGIINEDNSVDVVYCHFDGYLEGVGEELVKDYNSEGLAESLVAEGGKSSIGSPYEPYEEPTHYDSLEEYKEKIGSDIFIEYVYLWSKKEGRWLFIKGNIYKDGDYYDGDIPLWLDEAVALQRSFK